MPLSDKYVLYQPSGPIFHTMYVVGHIYWHKDV